ncbi:hypothetical protein PPSIR1_30250 [Plesiocystis pacifica SIR-1]|uniref:LysM domain-containing protein n=1 Tax=Plesiocystis pacifica SIR-1 TaxID=391625 RepID=A6FZ29_9BACT|nr:LysM peptidoglycan-binding domain-containing protein [Plesiocystis pacifica]EDM81184.1 hypothetical protein PPSIR1_30250 [Plesiocystis pacifica SIR-1]
MSLGYALLHADRIEAAITGVSEGQVAADEGVDIGVAALALERPESLIQDYVRGVITQFEAFVARIQGAFESGAGVLGEIRRALDSLLELDLDTLRLTPLVDGLVELVSALDPAVLGPRIREFCERLLVVFPELSGGELLETILDIALGGLEVLEGPRLSGRDDIAAHRAFRAARIARAWIAKTLAPVREFLADLDLHAVICGGVQTLIAQLEFDGGALRQIAEGVRDFLRPVAVAVDALLELRVSVSISVNASASAGAQGMPGEDGEVLWLDDTRVTPHGPDHGLWWTDLLTNVASLGWGVFDVVNYGPYASGRAWDGILCTLGLVWKGVRGLVRALRPDFLCDEQWNTGGAFWFSELGDFCIHAFLATVEALIYEGGRLANLVMSIAVRLGRYYTFTVGPRLPYIIARAIWYARSWKEDGWVIEHEVAAGETLEQIAAAHGVEVDELRRWNRLGADESPEVGRTLLIVPDDRGEAPGRVRPPISFTRYSWLGWGFMYLFGMIGGLIQPWDRFEVEKFADAGEGGGWWAFSRWLVFGLGLIAAIVGPWLIFGAWPWDRHYEVDGLTFAVYVGTMLFVALVAMGSMYSTNVTRDSWWVMLIVIGVVLAVLITVAVLWANEGDDELLGATHVLYWFSLIIGAVIFGLLPIILWMYYLQDGRDKEGLFAGMATKRGVTPTQLREAAPYKLPYPQGETWNCGQGVHGMWSHVNSSIGNLYSYDFLELQDKPSLAARGGMVVEIVQSNPYNNPTQNDVIIQHLDWSRGHDPGTEDERVQTFSDYIHIGPDCAHIDVGQRVVQGQHIINIDSTGISAQHHLHFGASASADYSHTIPVVFADASLQTARGFAHDPGRPRSGCLYTSDNHKVAAPARPIQLKTVAASPRGEASAHHHTLDIDLDQLELDGRPRGGTLRLQTSQDHGHRHEVELDAATLARLLDHEAPGELTAASAMSGELAHTHRFEPEARAGGAPGGKVRMPVAWVSVTRPPTAQAMARSAGPYDLRAHQIVARVDDRANAFLFFAAQRASIVGALCLGRGPAQPNGIRYGEDGNVTKWLFTVNGRHSVCEAAHKLSERLGEDPWVIRPIPALVIETRGRGNAAHLEVDCDPSNAAFGVSGIVDARGQGFDPHAVSRAALIARCEEALNQAPAAAPPSAVTASLAGSGTTLEFGGAAVSVSAGPRAQTIFAGLYDAGTKRLKGDGTLPFGAGRIQLSGGGKTLEVPIAGAPAWVELDQGPAWLSPAHINATPLHVKVTTARFGSARTRAIRASAGWRRGSWPRSRACGRGTRAASCGSRPSTSASA